MKNIKDYEEKAKELLKKAIISEPWKGTRNQTRYALMVDGEVIGYMRQKVDIKEITVGEIHETWRGRKIELMYDNEHIGFLWE